MMKNLRKSYSIKRVFFTIVSFAFIMGGGLLSFGCSSSDKGSDSVPLAAPNNMAVSPKHEQLTVQFTRVAGIGAAGSEVYPGYEVSVGDTEDPGQAKVLGSVPSSDNTYLIAINIKKTITADDNSTGGNFLQHDLEDAKKYYIFVRSYFEGYGYSGYASVTGTPVPLPTAVEGAAVAKGDKRLLVSWTGKPYEQYSVMIDDCPQKRGQLTKWSPKNIIYGNNYVATLGDNIAEHKVCMVSRNENGNGEWYLFGATVRDNGTIDYSGAEYKGEDATVAPAKPVLTVRSEANKRIVVGFEAAVTGTNSVSKYQIAYKKASDGVYSPWSDIDVTSVNVETTVANLENGVPYNIKINAINTVNTSGMESDPVTATPKQSVANLDDPDEFLGLASATFIYAENIPHSDFWRLDTRYPAGGRPNTDRLVRGKETAIGDLYADGLQWYAKEKGFNTDFAFLIGDMVNNGIQAGTSITPRFLMGITNIEYLEDTVVIASVPGSALISDNDYALDLNNYPAVGINGIGETLFGQAASVYRNGHYGGSGGTTYNGEWWGLPSSEARYVIEYLPYSLDLFNTTFNTNCAGVIGQSPLYDVKTDPRHCYILTYDQASPSQGAPGENSVMGYKRGKIKTGGLTVAGAAIDPNKTYVIATTKKIADTRYAAFLKGRYEDTGVTLIRALSEYIFDKGGAAPYLDGRVKLEGGVPGDSANDFQNQ